MRVWNPGNCILLSYSTAVHDAFVVVFTAMEAFFRESPLRHSLTGLPAERRQDSMKNILQWQ